MAQRRVSPAERPSFWLGIVSLGFVFVELLIITPRVHLSWDEALYISQFSTSVPAMGLDAHRSLGVPLLVAPIAAVTASIPAIRIYLSIVAGLGLFLAYRPWLRFGAPATTLAALLFATLSVTLTNGNVALPNMFAALAAVAGAGSFLAAVSEPGPRRPLAGLVVAFSVLSLVRPTDAVWTAMPLLAATVVVPSWRRRALGPVAAIAGGLAVGGAVWGVEAYIRFGGPLARLEITRQITGSGVHLVVLDEVAALGRRVAEGPWNGMLIGAVLQWSVVAGLLILGLRSARRTPAMPAWTLAAVTALTVSAPYQLLLSYPSGRYLLSGAAFLAFPVGGAVHRVLATRPRPRGGSRIAAALVTAGVVMVVSAHIGSQIWVARSAIEHSREAREASARFAERLRGRGPAPPCFVSGSFAPQIAYVLRCSAGDVAYAARRASVEVGSWQERHPESVPALTERDLRTARSSGQRFVVVARSPHRPAHLAGWPRVRVLADRPWYAYYPPDRGR